MHFAILSKARSTCCLAWCAGLVSAPDPTKFTSAWWDDGPLEEVTLPSAHELLAAFSRDSALQIHQPRWGRHRLQTTTPPVLRPQSPASPSLGRDLIINPAASFQDISLDSALIPKAPKDDRVEAYISGPKPIFSPYPNESCAPGVTSTPTDARSTGSYEIEWDSFVTQKTGIPIDRSIKITQNVSSDENAHNTVSQSWVQFALNQLDLVPKAAPFAKSKASSNPNPNTTPAQSHTRAFTSTSTAKEINQDYTRSRTQKSMELDNPIIETPDEIVSGDDHQHHQEPTQVSRIIRLNRPLDITRNRSLISKLKREKAARRGATRQIIKEQPYVRRLLLKQYDDQFYGTVISKEFVSQRNTPKYHHVDLPLAIAHPQSSGPGYVIRIVSASNRDYVQSPDLLLSHYKRLIKCVYDVHEERLNTLDIPIYVHRIQHQKLFEWLYKEMFDNRVPLIGRKMISVPEWRNDDIVEGTQLELLIYFSQGENDYQSTLSTAILLLQSFIDKQQGDSGEPICFIQVEPVSDFE
ncbi:hypothetical protein PGT21_022761 [Puccinia graminis f. sp. tritici]|uniref:Uncharacterized protein n=1 Tax=Puccinia graminis f. sp. tritici TaxID=56615 RepID=A0A5B0P7H3_PUCGR|nr:hypothetical protein PGT21_022761 [Puccinia graminis f. sp. tritici]KAA1131826.1 hypothetical protein PGTUg99_028071 [Puccinia graminis f. sp. tritici]